jgi:thymidylate kinase
MFTVALIGPDGAGKTTIGRRLEHTLPLPVKYIYMGVNTGSSNSMLPTTRLIAAIKRACGAKPDTTGPPDPDRVRTRPKGVARRTAVGLKEALGMANRMSEEWFRQGLAWYWAHRGYIVIFDRHFYVDYYAYDIANNGKERPFFSRLHGFMLDRVYPKPDLVIYLDAPATVLFARKGEGTLKALEHRRQEYLQLRDVLRNFEIVDASRLAEEVERDVREQICGFYNSKAGKHSEHDDARN